MARKSKKLKFDLTENKLSQNDTRVHFDRKDNLLAEEHYGFYLIAKVSSSRSELNPRIYLSIKHKKEYYEEKLKQGNRWYNQKPKKTKTEIFDGNKNYLKLIKTILDVAFSQERGYELTKSILNGFHSFIVSLKKRKRSLENISDISKEDILNIFQYFHTLKSMNKQQLIDLDKFLGAINISFPQLNTLKKELREKLDSKNKQQKNVTHDRFLASSIVYQLEICIKKEYEELKEIVRIREKWMKEFDDPKFITKEDIIKTIFDNIEKNSTINIGNFVELLLLKLKNDFGISTDFFYMLKNSYNYELSYNQNRYIELKKKEFKKISLNGRNIDIKSEKYAMYWLRELFPEYPYCNLISSKYEAFNKGNFRSIRAWCTKQFNIKLKSLDKKLYPTNNELYPVFLLLLIKTGANQEVLKNIEIKLNQNGDFIIDGDDLGLFTIIDGIKNRSNSEISITIKNSSIEKKYLDLYIKYCTEVYKHSKDNRLFQYVNMSGGLSKKYQFIENTFLTNIKNSPTSFYKKYEIFDIDGARLNFIKHTSIRKSHNYQDFLKGKEAFERQTRKTHKSGDTTRTYYEDQNLEWEEAKKHKIALAQNLIVGIFKGKITRKDHKTAALFYGPLADCKDNKHPTFDNTLDMKNNEFCTDWTKCLTRCDKSCVIPKVHGPVIFAWIDYMQEMQEDFMRQQDWEKEYLIDYNAAQDTVSHFTNEEKQYCVSEKHKHVGFVKMKFKKTVKL